MESAKETSQQGEREARRMLGPNAKRLIAIKMSRDAIPDGQGLEAGLRFLSNKESIVAGAKSAVKWVSDAIDAVRCAQEPNPFVSATDEEIAGEILRRLEAGEAVRPDGTALQRTAKSKRGWMGARSESDLGD